MILVIPVFLPHRGCPHDCLFCNQNKISGETGQGENPEAVSNIIEEWLPRARHTTRVQVAFFGGSFTCLPKNQQQAYLGAVHPYLESGAVDGIRLSTRPDCITSDIIEILKKSRVEVVELGVQSFDDAVLRKSLRGHNSAQSIAAFHQLKNAGMSVGLQLMVGLPGESRISFLRGIRQVCRLKPDFVRIYPVLVVKDSGLEKLYLKNTYKPLSLKKAVAMTSRAAGILMVDNIKIVRIGLQPSEELDASVLAGPYHPAFGELVLSRLWLKRLREKCALLEDNESLVVHISHRELSAALGHKRANIKRLHEIGYLDRVRIVGEQDLPRGTIHYVIN